MSCLQFAAQAVNVPSRPIHTSQIRYTPAQVHLCLNGQYVHNIWRIHYIFYVLFFIFCYFVNYEYRSIGIQVTTHRILYFYYTLSKSITFQDAGGDARWFPDNVALRSAGTWLNWIVFVCLGEKHVVSRKEQPSSDQNTDPPTSQCWSKSKCWYLILFFTFTPTHFYRERRKCILASTCFMIFDCVMRCYSFLY